MIRFSHLYFVLVLLVTAPLAHRVMAQSSTDSLVLAASDSVSESQPVQHEMGGYFYRIFFVTAFIILFMLAFLYFYKKFNPHTASAPRSKIKVLARQNIGAKQSVAIVIIEDKKYALGVTDHSVQLISELGLATSEEISSTEIKPIVQSFASIFAKVQKK